MDMDTNQNTLLKFKRLSENATIPRRSSPYSAGLDLFSAEFMIIEPQSCARIKTDIAVKLPHGTYGVSQHDLDLRPSISLE